MLAFALTVLLQASLALAAPQRLQGRKCGSNPSQEEVDRDEVQFAQLNATNVVDESTSKHGKSIIPVYWHVIQKSRLPEDGHLTSAQIHSQIKTLNKGYAGHVKFVLAGVDYTTNPDWFKHLGPNSPLNTVVKNKLHKGDKATLNLYSTGFVKLPPADEGLLGYATTPASVASALKKDGVVILFSTIPGGSEVPFNLGYTATHEVGHWLGLYHTFQGGCTGLGDHVFDTPAEATPAFGCPKGRDTCKKQPGLDPIHNFMDYTDDPCMTKFTSGQFKRIKWQAAVYRGIMTN